jgi:antitoxin MazE
MPEVIEQSTMYTHNRYMANTVSRWGNSLAVRIPKALAEQAGLVEGAAVEMMVADGAVVVRAQGPVYTLDELVKGITPKNRHKEVSTGAPQGREVW